MIPFTVLTLGSSGDIDLTKGLRFTPDLVTYTAQRLFDNLSFFLNEWFLDLREGIPYFEKIIGQKPDLPLIDTLYRRAILATPGVGAITNLQLDFDRTARALAIHFEATLVDGTTITETDIGRPFVVTLG
jgi:hypothetical protein